MTEEDFELGLVAFGYACVRVGEGFAGGTGEVLEVI